MKDNQFIDLLLNLTGERDIPAAAAKLATRELASLSNQWHERLHPVPVLDLALRHGVSPLVRFTRGGPSAQIASGNGVYVLTLNQFEGHPRNRFSMAHELAHILISEASGQRLHAVQGMVVERFCDEFASRLILPDRLLISWLERCGGTVSLETIERGSKQLVVSQQMFVKRLGELDLLDKDQRGVIVSSLGTSRKAKTNLDLRIHIVATPSWGFLPTNRRLRSIRLHSGIRAFERSSKDEIQHARGTILVRTRPAYREVVLNTTFEHKVYHYGRARERYLLSVFAWPPPPTR